MSTQLIPTVTEIHITGTDIEILTRYYNGIVATYAFIAGIVGSIDGVPYDQGDGMIVVPSGQPVFILDSSGQLLVFGADADKYSVDDDTGQLKYTI